MRIGIDARVYHSGNPSGRLWIRQVIEQLLLRHPGHEFVLFLREEDRGRPLPAAGGRVEARYCALGSGLFNNALVLPAAGVQANIDVLLTQYFSAPSRSFRQVTVVHDVIFKTHPEFFTPLERAYFAAMRPLLRFADVLVTDSEHSREQLSRFDFVRGSQKCFVIPCGVDARYFKAPEEVDRAAFRQKRGLPDRFVLYVGRLNKRKNIPNLVRAMAALEENDAGLVLCGRPDSTMSGWEPWLLRNDVGRRVIRLDPVSDGDLVLLYSCAAAFAYVSEQEGFGLPPLEAMACGVPVVISDRACLPEICGDAALQVDPSSIEAIAGALHRLLSEKALRDQLVEKGRHRAETFSWAVTADRIVQIIEGMPRRKPCESPS